MAAGSAGSSVAAKAGEQEIVATRVFAAPRELVFELWTDPQHIARWWGPDGFTTTIHEMDVRPGGVWRFVMHGPDARDYQNKIVYVEIAKPERIVYDHVSGPPFRVTVTFTEQGDKTELTVRMLFESAGQREAVIKEFGAIEGLNQTLGRLEQQLAEVAAKARSAAPFTMPSDRELVITRVFDAPRDLVFKAWTEPQRLMQWWGPKGFTTPYCTVDLRLGGIFHYCMRSPEGRDVWGRGVYREISKPERIVYADAFADEKGNPVPPAHYGMSPGHPSETLVTVTFTEHGGKTKVTLHHAVPESVPERSGIQQGWTEMLDRLADELAKA